jgi:hypothetical protein
MKIKKKKLLSEIKSLQEEIESLAVRLTILESVAVSNPASPLTVVGNSRCSQCNNDLSQVQSCMSVNCPYSYQVTCNGK